MKRFWKVAVAGAAIALVTGLSVGQALASPPTGYGYDGTSHVIVGAGSDTTYFTMLGITDLYNRSGVSSGCVANTTIGPSLNECVLTGSPETNDLGNWQHDTVGEANPVGSSVGVASLNAASSSSYAGTVNPAPSYLGSGLPTGPNADFARSSRGPKTTGGNVIGAGNELSVDTFWGYAQDGIEIVSFNNRGTQLQGDHTGLTPNELFGIFNCTITQWSQVPSLGIAPGSATDGPIVPWGINTSSGTFATFQSYIQSNASGVPSGWSPDGQACDRKLSNGIFPFENDLKPIINDPASLSASATSTDNPENWITWGSFGDMSAFPFKSAVTRGIKYQSKPAPVNGIIPSSQKVLLNTYPIGRTLFHVTRKQDADCPKTGSSCDFAGHPGPAISGGITDMSVTGGTSGIGGSVREFTRFLCRGDSTQQKSDPYTGINEFDGITAAVNSSGFTTVPFALQTDSGTRCDVIS